jgi:hypothetical protein
MVVLKKSKRKKKFSKFFIKQRKRRHSFLRLKLKRKPILTAMLPNSKHIMSLSFGNFFLTREMIPL